MRIALINGATTYPLAGEAGVDERMHTSAADFRMTGHAGKQSQTFVRAAYGQEIDRGNLFHGISFTTARQFSTPQAAFLYSLDYAASHPRDGILQMDTIGSWGAIARRQMTGALVDPPGRRVIGCSLMLDYHVSGGQIITAAAPTGRMIVAGLGGDGSANGIYAYDSVVNGKPKYVFGTNSILWLGGTTGWYLSNVDQVMNSADDVVTPDLATWLVYPAETTLSGFSLTMEIA